MDQCHSGQPLFLAGRSRATSTSTSAFAVANRTSSRCLPLHRSPSLRRARRYAPPFAARSPAFTELLLEYSRRYPDMHVDLVTEGQLRDIVADGFDLGIRVASPIPSDMIALSLGESQRFAVVASPTYMAGGLSAGADRSSQSRLHPRPLARWRALPLAFREG
ncbi:LysR substrate-binding domain-containing protein [Sphingopyxis terrae subsp. ummariensis]